MKRFKLAIIFALSIAATLGAQIVISPAPTFVLTAPVTIGGATFLTNGNVGIGLADPDYHFQSIANISGAVASDSDQIGHQIVTQFGSSSPLTTGSLSGISQTVSANTDVAIQRIYGLYTSAHSVPNTHSVSYQYGNVAESFHDGVGTVDYLTGMVSKALVTDEGTATTAHGIWAKSQNMADGLITFADGITATYENLGTGRIENGFGVKVITPLNSGGGEVWANYGIYLNDQRSIGLYANFALYSEGGDVALLNGNVGFGLAVPTAIVHIKAGTATASTAPLKFTSGVNLSTAEAGAMEYNGTNLFFTRAGTTREGVLTQSAVTTEVLVSDTSVTVNIGGTTYKLLAKN